MTETTSARILSTNTGLSIALVVVLLAAGSSSVGMIFTVRQRSAIVEFEVKGLKETVVEIKSTLNRFTESTARSLQEIRADRDEEIRELRKQIQALEMKVARMEALSNKKE